MTEAQLVRACREYETITGSRPVRLTVHPADRVRLMNQDAKIEKHMGDNEYLEIDGYLVRVELDHRCPLGQCYIAREDSLEAPGLVMAPPRA